MGLVSRILFMLVLVQSIDCQWNSRNFYQHPEIPHTLRGEWFSRERGLNNIVTIDGKDVTGKGRLLDLVSNNNENFTMVLFNTTTNCHYCIRLLMRTPNVLEKIESTCIIPPSRYLQSSILASVCRNLDANQESITMFSTNPSGRNCRSSLEGRWRFAYQTQDKFTNECKNSDSRLTACQIPGTQFFNLNQQFRVEYKSCDGMRETQDASIEYKCLGDWYVGKNHYFAVKNTRDSRVEEAYRCMLTNRDDDQYISVSTTAECNTLRSPQQGPERWHLSAIKDDNLVPKCSLPHNLSGIWINTANFDAEVTIDGTRMIEKWRPDSGRLRQEQYVCIESRNNRYLMARLGVNGCQKDHVCFKFMRKQNTLRYRKGQAFVSDVFSTVCSWSSFEGQENWVYDIMIAMNPTPIRCPIAGKFRFEQQGDILFENRTRGGVTMPKPNIYCKQRVPDVSVCSDQKTIAIEPNYCISVDQFGKPLDIYSEPDYELQCLDYWRENLKSYLITYDPSDAYSRYRCWVYQRTDQNKISISMSVGAFCHATQTEQSSTAKDGAQVALALTEYERESDDCPMHYDDGSNSNNELTI